MMLRRTVDAVVPSLTKLFNLSLTSGAFPEAWKLARIVPVPKSGDMSSPSNYRPISILSIVSKLLERHVYQLLFQHLRTNYPISSKQWGFLPGRCTSSALLTVTHDWLHQLELGNEVVHQVSQDSCMSLFADDMALYRPIHSTADYYELQRDISAIVNWINASLLALQPSKCCYMIIARKRSLKLPPPLSWLRALH